jgi:hypothetical protein
VPPAPPLVVPVPVVPVPVVPVALVPVPEPDPVPLMPDELVPLEPVLPLMPLVPVEPDEPVPLPLLEEPLAPSMLDPLDVLPELPLEPELLLCFFDCFFLLDLWVDDLPVFWSDCELALVVSPVDELPLVCA